MVYRVKPDGTIETDSPHEAIMLSEQITKRAAASAMDGYVERVVHTARTRIRPRPMSREVKLFTAVVGGVEAAGREGVGPDRMAELLQVKNTRVIGPALRRLNTYMRENDLDPDKVFSKSRDRSGKTNGSIWTAGSAFGDALRLLGGVREKVSENGTN